MRQRAKLRLVLGSDKEGRKIKIPLNQILLKYIPDGKKLLITRKGKCQVCGRTHSTEAGWKRCARKRAEEEKGLIKIFSSATYSLDIWDTLSFSFFRAVFSDMRLVTEEPDPILVCSLPAEKIEKVRKDLREYMETLVNKLSKKIRESVQREIEKGANDPRIKKLLRENNLDDAVGLYLTESILNDRPFSGWRVEPYSRELSDWKLISSFRPFVKWLLDKAHVEEFLGRKGVPLGDFRGIPATPFFDPLLFVRKSYAVARLRRVIKDEGGFPTGSEILYVVIDLRNFRPIGLFRLSSKSQDDVLSNESPQDDVLREISKFLDEMEEESVEVDA